MAATKTTKTASKTHYLHYLFNEDEAEHTGFLFTELADGCMHIRQSFHFTEYEDANPGNIYSRNEARELWARLIKTGSYKHVR